MLAAPNTKKGVHIIHKYMHVNKNPWNQAKQVISYIVSLVCLQRQPSCSIASFLWWRIRKSGATIKAAWADAELTVVFARITIWRISQGFVLWAGQKDEMDLTGYNKVSINNGTGSPLMIKYRWRVRILFRRFWLLLELAEAVFATFHWVQQKGTVTQSGCGEKVWPWFPELMYDWIKGDMKKLC